MALMDLKSDLSWHGAKAPGPYKSNANKSDTKFKLDENGDRIPIESDKGSLAEIIEKQRIEDITMQDPQGELGDKGTVTGMEEVIGTNILDERNKKLMTQLK